jgi:hypothetical protein
MPPRHLASEFLDTDAQRRDLEPMDGGRRHWACFVDAPPLRRRQALFRQRLARDPRRERRPSHEVALFRFLPGTDGVPHVEHGMALPFEVS